MSGFPSGNATEFLGIALKPGTPTNGQIWVYSSADNKWELGSGGGGGGADALDTYIVATTGGAHNNVNDIAYATVNGYGTLASRPASATEGFVWFASDTFQFYRWTSAAWVSITPLGTDTTKLAIANNLSDVAAALTAFANISPMTTNGDVITRAAGVPSRLGIGAGGSSLIVDNGAPAYGLPAQWGQENVLCPSDALYETIPRFFCTSSFTQVSGTLHVCGLWLPANKVITFIRWYRSTVLSSATNQIFGLYDNTKALLKPTSNDTTTPWGGNSYKTLNLTAPFTTTYSGLHYIACMCTDTVSAGALGATTPLAGIQTVGNVICGNTSDTGLTTALPNPFGTIIAATNISMGMVG